MSDQNEILTISEDELKELKRKYETTPDEGTFFFKGKEILKEYAKYIIEYLEEKFKPE